MYAYELSRHIACFISGEIIPRRNIVIVLKPKHTFREHFLRELDLIMILQWRIIMTIVYTSVKKRSPVRIQRSANISIRQQYNKYVSYI